MLSEDEKNKIMLEEQYRDEIRSQLENSDKKKWSHFLDFFNTNLGLFVLSTLLLSGTAFIYNFYEERQNQLNERERMKNELVHRFNTLQSLNDTLFWYQTTDMHLAFQGNSRATGLKVEYYNFHSVYQEFSHWPIYRLINQILEIQSDQKLEEILQLFERNEETINHLREHWFLKLNSGKVLPKRVPIRQGTKEVRGRKIRYDYYKENSQERVIIEKDRPITKMAKINENSDLISLIELLSEY